MDGDGDGDVDGVDDDGNSLSSFIFNDVLP